MQSSYPYTINIDWLQVFCHDENDDLLYKIYNGRSAYEFKINPYGTRHFKELYEVLDEDGDKYAIIQRNPHSSVLSEDAAIVQLCNRELYRPHFASEFLVFLGSHKFKYKSISRLDVCFDSNHLLNKLRHSNLIKGLMTGLYLKNNQSKVKWSFDSVANVGKPMECNSCSFGSKSSSVSTKMYNKSLEMREVKLKPYIVENWAYNGINVEQDVWRIEISIKSDASNTIRTDTGEIFRLSADSLAQQEMVENIFFSYAKKYFAFKRNTGGKNKTRMPDLEIFPKNRTITLHPLRITNEKDSTRSDRIFLKKLYSLMQEFERTDSTAWNALVEVTNVFIITRGLSEWRKKTLGVAELRRNFEEVSKKVFHEDLNKILQTLLERYPKGAPHIHELSTLIYKIIKS